MLRSALFYMSEEVMNIKDLKDNIQVQFIDFFLMI